MNEMTEENFSALLAKLKDDTGLQQKLHAAQDLEAALEICKEAGFEFDKGELLSGATKDDLELTDNELEGVSGGTALIALGALIWTIPQAVAGAGVGLAVGFTLTKCKKHQR